MATEAYSSSTSSSATSGTRSSIKKAVADAGVHTTTRSNRMGPDPVASS